MKTYKYRLKTYVVRQREQLFIKSKKNKKYPYIKKTLDNGF